MSASLDFDWDDNADDIVQQSVERVAIFTNPNGDLVIRQERCWDQEDDTWIIIARGNVGAAIAKMRGAIGEEPSTPRDHTAAERQRRYRQRHRNGQDRNDRYADSELLLRLPAAE